MVIWKTVFNAVWNAMICKPLVNCNQIEPLNSELKKKINRTKNIKIVPLGK